MRLSFKILVLLLLPVCAMAQGTGFGPGPRPSGNSLTNSASSVAPNFALDGNGMPRVALLSTNAAFTFLAPVGVDVTKTTRQETVIYVTNTTAAAVLITPPANCHGIGTAYVTNLTRCDFEIYASKWTNCFFVPCY